MNNRIRQMLNRVFMYLNGPEGVALAAALLWALIIVREFVQ